MTRILTTLLFTLLLSACGDSGVYVGSQTGTGNTGTNNSTNNNNNNGGGANTTGGDTTTNNNTSTGGNNGGAPIVTNTGTGDPVTTVASSNLDPADADAARFLNQATFGATNESIAEFRMFSSKGAWIDAQMALPISLTRPYTEANSNGSNATFRHHIWMDNALNQPDQLRQRVAFALSQIFVISDIDKALSNAQYGMTDYYDMLARNAFGNYRTLLEDVALHPTMGVYLSMLYNEKANPAENIRPDENFAREILQLFSIGLFQLDNRGEIINRANPTPSYTQNNIEEFARVFTGWGIPGLRYWNDTRRTNDSFIGRMVPVEEFHDTGSKTLLNGAVTPAGLSTEQDMQRALDNIFQHQNVGPFISKLLIQRLTTSNPSPDYVGRVSSVFNNNGTGVRGDLGSVIKAILLDNEAQQGINANPDFGKIREPNIKLAHYWRAMNGTPGPDANNVHNTPDFVLNRLHEMGGQAVMKSPSVFNFYRPENQLRPGQPLLAPEMQNMTEAYIAATHINYHHLVYRFNNRKDPGDDSTRVTINDFDPLAELARNPDDLLDWYNLVFFGGTMPDTMRATLREYMLTLPSDNNGRYARALDTTFMMMVSPALNIQR